MRRLLGTAATALALTMLVGCSGPSGTRSSGGADGGGAAAVPGPVLPAGPEDAPADPTDSDADRQVVTTAYASLAVADPAEGAQQVSELVESAGGRVDERTEQAASAEAGREGAVADLVARVPATALTGVLADLEELGDVEHVSVSRSDVTAAAVDLDARIAALQSSVARLQSLMAGAATTEALLAAEKALAERQEQLESLQSRRSVLADQVELSTLSVHLEPYGVAPVGGPDGFLEGVGTGWRALVAALGTVVVVLGVVLPWLAVAVPVAVAVLVPVRRRARRRAAARAAATPASVPPQPVPPPGPAPGP